jgi:hypothetical protein
MPTEFCNLYLYLHDAPTISVLAANNIAFALIHFNVIPDLGHAKVALRLGPPTRCAAAMFGCTCCDVLSYLHSA